LLTSITDIVVSTVKDRGALLQSVAMLRSERKLTLLYPPPPRHLER